MERVSSPRVSKGFALKALTHARAADTVFFQLKENSNMSKINNWTKSIIVLSLMYSLFSFTATAQKPLQAKSLAALIVEFKEVVSKNAPNQNDAQLIGAKWDKRKDLAGKTKADVISLLYDDVKSVIKDSGVQYQIYSIFSFHKQIPDDFQAEKSAPSKPEAIEKLIELTFSAHPSSGFTEKMKTEMQTEEMKSNQNELFDDALAVNKKLTAKQKAFVKANYSRLGKIIDRKNGDITKANFRVEDWLKESFEQSYTDEFTVEELNELIVFFQETEGQGILNLFRMMTLTGENAADETQKIALENFKNTTLGDKFLRVYFKDSNTYVEQKMKTAYGKQEKDIFALLDTANLNKIINQFVAENFKK